METLIAALISLFTAANTLTPIALIGLMIGVLYIQIFRQPSKQELDVVKDNHLHGLPQIEENTRLIVGSLHRIETQQAEKFATIISKLEN